MAADGAGFDDLSATRAEAFAALDRRLDPARRAPLVVGLSGGGDSLALLVLALDWGRAARRPVLALTVDHGLHGDSARWTAQAGATARALGVEWRALVWSGAKPSTGLPAAARRARHALLAQAARSAGAAVLLLGHTADDVAESELIREDTPNHGVMRDWAPSPVWPEGRGVFVMRPLLQVRRAALRAMMTARGLGWFEDPANADPRFARTRARASLEDAPRSPVSRRFPGEGRGPGRQPLRKGPEPGPRPSPGKRGGDGEGVIAFDIGTWPRDQRAAALARAICCASGRETPPPGAAVARLAARAATGAVATLGGARVVFDGDTVTLCRELGRRAPEPLALTPGEPRVFDGRFEITADAPGWRVAALAGHAARLPRFDQSRLADIAALARPALPVLLDQAGAAHLPRPLGAGPGEARALVAARLAAAFGRIDSEADVARDLRARSVHGA